MEDENQFLSEIQKATWLDIGPRKSYTRPRRGTPLFMPLSRLRSPLSLWNSDLARIINSDEVQSVVRPIKKEVKRVTFNYTFYLFIYLFH